METESRIAGIVKLATSSQAPIDPWLAYLVMASAIFYYLTKFLAGKLLPGFRRGFPVWPLPIAAVALMIFPNRDYPNSSGLSSGMELIEAALWAAFLLLAHIPRRAKR